MCLLATIPAAQAGNWPQWRGPNFNGSSLETDLPDEWSRTQNITWKTELAGVAAATPIVWNDHVFLAGTRAETDTLQALCLDRDSGKILWSHDIAQGTRRDYRSTFAASSPVTDGQRVIFFFGSGDLVCFDFDGQRQWQRNIQEDFGTFAFLWTFASSPLLYDGKLYVQVLQRDVAVEGRGLIGQINNSYLLAVDPASGKTLWRHIRPSKARAESREAFTTPIPFEYNGRTELLVAGGDLISGHDPETGRELWRWGTWNPERIPHWRLVPSPVAGGGVVLACAPKRDPIYAVKAGGVGVLDDDALAWVSTSVREVSADVPTPAFYDGDFFVLSDVRRCLSRVEPKTGKTKWIVETPGRTKYEASPLAADGKIYLINFDGEVAIFSAETGEQLKVIAMDRPEDGEKVRASIVASDGQLFIRTARTLYCVGKRRG
jgi:outer membrane protein assembly factor BamB